MNLPPYLIRQHEQILECEADGFTTLAEALRVAYQRHLWIYQGLNGEETAKLPETASNPARK